MPVDRGSRSLEVPLQEVRQYRVFFVKACVRSYFGLASCVPFKVEHKECIDQCP